MTSPELRDQVQKFVQSGKFENEGLDDSEMTDGGRMSSYRSGNNKKKNQTGPYVNRKSKLG